MFNKKVNSSLFLNEYPESLKKYWVQVTPLKNHTSISYVIGFYANNKYKPQTIVVSDYITNDYPDLYLTLDKNLMANRVFTNPALRPSGAWKWVGVFIRLFFFNNMNNLIVDCPPVRDRFADYAYKNTKKILKEKFIHKKKDTLITYNHEEPPREVIYPYIWYNKRIKEVSNEKN